MSRHLQGVHVVNIVAITLGLDYRFLMNRLSTIKVGFNCVTQKLDCSSPSSTPHWLRPLLVRR